MGAKYTCTVELLIGAKYTVELPIGAMYFMFEVHVHKGSR